MSRPGQRGFFRSCLALLPCRHSALQPRGHASDGGLLGFVFPRHNLLLTDRARFVLSFVFRGANPPVRPPACPPGRLKVTRVAALGPADFLCGMSKGGVLRIRPGLAQPSLLAQSSSMFSFSTIKRVGVSRVTCLALRSFFLLLVVLVELVVAG